MIMAEKESVQPLLLFCLVALLSFSTGVFVGNMVTLHLLEDSSVETDSENLKIISQEDVIAEEELSGEPVEDSGRENTTLDRYKDMLQKSIDESSQNEEFFKNYGIVVGSYTNIDKANNTAINLKSQYNWEVAVYPMDDFHKVIIGPFDSQESAQTFLEQMPKVSRFISAQVTELPD